MSEISRRHSCRRQGDAHEVRAPEGAPCGRRPLAHRPRPGAAAGAQPSDSRSSSDTAPTRCGRIWRIAATSSSSLQEPQLGTGHALLPDRTAPPRAHPARWSCCRATCRCSRSATLSGLVRHAHRGRRRGNRADGAYVDRPYGYGRIVRSNGRIDRIVEERDASPAQREIQRDQLRHLRVRCRSLFDALDTISSDNTQGEYYLPDLIAIYRRRRRVVTTFTIPDAVEIRGINSRTELAEVSAMVRQQKNEELMAAGVTIVDPATTYIDTDVASRARHRHSPVRLPRSAARRIGGACEIHAGSRIVNATIGDRVAHPQPLGDHRLDGGGGRAIGPFAHLRPRRYVARGRARRQLRRVEEDHARRRQQGQSSGVSGRCDDRRQSERRRRHHHLQLRRHHQAPDRHRGRRLRRQQFDPRRTGHRRARTPMSRRGRRSPTTFPPARSASAAAGRKTRT